MLETAIYASRCTGTGVSPSRTITSEVRSPDWPNNCTSYWLMLPVSALRADVPVGAYLSGGLDSSALVALIRRHSTMPLKTFSIGFEDSHDESVFQRQLVRPSRRRSPPRFCHNRDIAEDFPTRFFMLETAILRTAPTPMRRLSSLVRAQGTGRAHRRRCRRSSWWL